MHIAACPESTSLEIKLSYTSNSITKMTSQMRGMDINAMLNPTVDLENIKPDSSQHKAEILHQLPMHTRPQPVEPKIGEYSRPYPSPVNTPTLRHSSTVGAQTSDFHEKLPSFSELVGYPSPTLTIASIYSASSASNVCSYDSSRHGEEYYQYEVSYQSSRSRQHYHRQHSPPSRNSHHSRPSSSRSRHSNRYDQESCLHRVAHSPSHYVDAQSSAAIKKTKKDPHHSHSNQPYRPDQVAWTRYHKIDLNGNWKAISSSYQLSFNGLRPLPVKEGGLSSRFYRDNYIPKIDSRGRMIRKSRSSHGDKCSVSDIEVLNVKVRSKNNPEFADTPWTFRERHPWSAVSYPWVLPEHKAEAQHIIDVIEAKDPSEYTRKEQYIVAIRQYDLMKMNAQPGRRESTLSLLSNVSEEDGVMVNTTPLTEDDMEVDDESASDDDSEVADDEILYTQAKHGSHA